MIRRSVMIGLLVAHAASAQTQGHGAAALHALVNGLTVTPRVLLIGARPEDADADLIAWLARGHHVQTGFLALSRGESALNYAGVENGVSVGAVHVQEVLAARRIDGAEQYFTRAFDFGSAPSTDEAFKHWDHQELLGEVVSVVRAFRPHVIVARFRADTSMRDGQRDASAILAREVFDAAMDTVHYEVRSFGLPWAPTSLYEPGPGIAIDAREYNTVLGRTYADIAIESRAQLRSLGFENAPWFPHGVVELRRIATRGSDSAALATGSIFSGVDTTFARLLVNAPAVVARNLPLLQAAADSARSQLDLVNPARALDYLKQAVELASSTRALLRGCRHPAAYAMVSVTRTPCQASWLDLDASIDLVLRRATEAVLDAAGVSLEAVSDREFIAAGDTALVTITVFNHGESRVLLNDLEVTNSARVRTAAALDVPAHGSTTVSRFVPGLGYAHPWWIFPREKNFFPPATTPLDGVARPGVFMREFGVSGTAVPENIRRLSDVTATLTIGTTTLTSSMGGVVFKAADPVSGVRDRATSGTPAVTVGFERVLEWAPAGKPLKKQLRLAVRSYSDKPQRFSLKPVPGGALVKLDSMPPAITLAPHEARELSVTVRGTPTQMRYELPIEGIAPSDTFNASIRSTQYSYLPPLHVFRGSAVYVQGVNVEIPARLSVAYVRGAGDDADISLKQLGVPVYSLNNEGLLRFDLDGSSTVVIGPDAFRVDPGLLGQVGRLVEFARKGGTVVMLNNPQGLQSGMLPYPLSYSRPTPERVATSDAPVTALPDKSRLLSWPNIITGDDWLTWVGERTFALPSTADPRYATVVEMHDPHQPENRNTILVASVGKGRVIYTSLTFPQQVANGVPGAMRLLVNLLSAGLPRP